MHKFAGLSVAEILSRKQATIRGVPMSEGFPGWDSILNLKWEEINERAKTRGRLPNNPEAPDGQQVQQMNMDRFDKLLAMIRDLERRRIHFELSYYREGAVSLR